MQAPDPAEINVREHILRQAYLDFKRGEAIEAASAGLPVFLLKPRSKLPHRKGWQGEATPDRRKIGRMMRTHPRCNVGILTGRGLAVIDVDGIAGEDSIAELTKEHGLLPKTATSLTGRGGWHLFLRVESGVLVPNRVGLWPGVDIRGDGGYVAGAGSVHPNGNIYEWINRPSAGIATMPQWLLRAILAGKGPEAPAARKEVATGRTGDAAILAAEMIARFPVLGPGRRHGQMVRVVASLAGRGFHRDLVLDIADRWHEEFRGIARTGPMAARREAEACLASTLGSTKFAMAVGSSEDHRASCEGIELSPEVQALIRSGPTPEPGDNSLNCKRVTRVTGIGTRLCESRDDVAFVEALVIHAMHKVTLGEFNPDDPSGLVVMTHDQVRAIAKHRHGSEWDNKQFERLKLKYINRPGDDKPAARFELLRETVKGHKQPGGPAGIPSEYVATGIKQLFTMDGLNNSEVPR